MAVLQSSYLPWRGYFDIIASVDTFVFYDDVQYTTRDWRNRNRIKTPAGSRWITVPVCHNRRSQLIDETLIDRTRRWELQHRSLITQNYRDAPYIDDVTALLAPLADRTLLTISELNITLIRSICFYLGILTPFVASRTLGVSGRKTDRLVAILDKLGATSYLSGPSADAYLDKSRFAERGIELRYKTYDYVEYPQPWPPYDPSVSIVDLIANLGPAARDHIRSRSDDRVVVPFGRQSSPP